MVIKKRNKVSSKGDEIKKSEREIEFEIVEEKYGW